MVYVETWDEFAEKSELLFRSDPVKFRLVTRYRHVDGRLILKATDDQICLKYRTDQANDMKKLEKLNALFFTLMSKGLDATVMDSGPPEPTNAPSSQQTKRGRGRRQ